MFYANCHMHSQYSDGELSVRDLVKNGKEMGFGAMILTDHDTVKGYKSFKTECEVNNIVTRIGCEFSCRAFRKSIHICGFDFDAEHPEMKGLLEYQSARGRERYRFLFNRAKEKGLIKKGLVWENISDFYPENDYLYSYHAFWTGVKMGIYSEDESEDFYKLFKTTDLDRAYIDSATGRYALEPGTVVRAINASGGVAVVAHPGGLERYLDEFLAIGVKGFEVNHCENTDETVEFFDRVCSERGLYKFGGTDHSGRLAGLYEPELDECGGMTREDFESFLERRYG